jgi:HTH-type transcriptional regulator/antitoxin HigA
MILTFSSEKYKELLSAYQPKLIKNESENEEALRLIEELMNLSNRSPEQEAIYELLILLVEKFEREFYQPDTPKQPASMLSFLMEQRDLQPINLVGIFGSGSVTQDILSGKIKIDRIMAKQLSKFFSVDASLFVS